MEENKKLVEACQPNYEQEYHRLIKENSRLISDNAVLQKTIIEMCKNLFVKGGAE